MAILSNSNAYEYIEKLLPNCHQSVDTLVSGINSYLNTSEELRGPSAVKKMVESVESYLSINNIVDIDYRKNDCVEMIK